VAGARGVGDQVLHVLEEGLQPLLLGVAVAETEEGLLTVRPGTEERGQLGGLADNSVEANDVRGFHICGQDLLQAVITGTPHRKLPGKFAALQVAHAARCLHVAAACVCDGASQHVRRKDVQDLHVCAGGAQHLNLQQPHAGAGHADSRAEECVCPCKPKVPDDPAQAPQDTVGLLLTSLLTSRVNAEEIQQRTSPRKRHRLVQKVVHHKDIRNSIGPK